MAYLTPGYSITLLDTSTVSVAATETADSAFVQLLFDATADVTVTETADSASASMDLGILSIDANPVETADNAVVVMELSAASITASVLENPDTANASLAFVPVSDFEIYPDTATITDKDFIYIETPPADHIIRYTTDGTNPTGTSTEYTSPFTLPSGVYTVKAGYFLQPANVLNTNITSQTFTVTHVDTVSPFNGTVDIFATDYVSGFHDFNNDDIRLALFLVGLSPDGSLDTYSSEWEITGAEYTVGGFPLTLTTTDNGTSIDITVDSIMFTGTTPLFGYRYGVVYNNSKQGRIIAVLNPGTYQTVDSDQKFLSIDTLLSFPVKAAA